MDNSIIIVSYIECLWGKRSMVGNKLERNSKARTYVENNPNFLDIL